MIQAKPSLPRGSDFVYLNIYIVLLPFIIYVRVSKMFFVSFVAVMANIGYQ